MEKFLPILKKTAFFYSIDKGDIEKMLVCLGARTLFYDRGSTVFSEGEEISQIAILLSGQIQSQKYDLLGNKTILAVFSPAELFAEDFACSGAGALLSDYVASEPSYVMLIDRTRAMFTCGSCCTSHRQIILNLMTSIADKNIRLHKKIEITSKRTTREKLLAYLSSEASSRGAMSFDIPFNRQELSDYLEVDRSGLSVEIGKMKKEGLIESRKNHFEILS